MKKLKLLDLFYLTPIIEICHVILINFLYMYSIIRGKKHGKKILIKKETFKLLEMH